MPSNHVVKFLVDKEQFSRLKNNASLKGHKTLSAYMRELSLNRDLVFEKMLLDIHREVVKNGRTKS